MKPDLPDQGDAAATLKARTVGRGWRLLEPIDVAYERGEIDASEWHRRIGAIIGPSYLAATSPRGCAKRVKTNRRNGGRRTRKTVLSVQ
jgi:hypothetical protein